MVDPINLIQSHPTMKTKTNIAGTTGAVAGAGIGVGGATLAVSSAGLVTGLSGAGFTSGLAAIGGGAMIGGFAVATAGVGVLAVAGLVGGRLAYTRYKASRILAH